MSVDEFVDKWSKSELKETSSFQSFFDDLCRLVDHPTPTEFDEKGEDFTYEKYVEKTFGATGIADVWYRGKFAWEQKGKRKNLDAAYKQLLDYREALENPPLLIVSDFEHIIIHTNFNNTPKQIYSIELRDIGNHLALIEALFYNPDSLKPNGGNEQVSAYDSQLRIRLRTRNPVHIFSSYGMIYHSGGPCPPLEGKTNLQIFLDNLSKRQARFIKIDLEIRLIDRSRPSCSRNIDISSAGWSEVRTDNRFWHFRFDGDSNDICLGNDYLPLGEIKFYFVMNKNSQDFKDIEEKDYTPTESSILKNRAFSAIRTHYYHQTHQERIRRLYLQNPAQDTFIIKVNVRAGNFQSSMSEFQFNILWSDLDIPNLIDPNKTENIFNFHSYEDRSSISELRTALFEKLPIGSNVNTILDFLAENNMPYASKSMKHIGVTDVVDTHNAISLMLKIRNSHRRQITNFLFDEGRQLKDIQVEFHP